MTDIQVMYTGPIVKRAEAKERGLDYYFTGKPCKRGHIDQRRTKQCGCLSCDKSYYSENRQRIIDRAVKWQKDNHDARSEYMTAYWRDNKEALQEYHRELYYSNPELKRSYSLRYHYENRDRIIAAMSEYYENNKAEFAERSKKWRDENKEKVRAYKSNRKAIIRGAEGTHTAQDVKSIYDSQDGECVYCGADLSSGYHVDHIMPLVLGGSNWPENLQCLCPTCNLRKGPKHPDDWHKEIGFT